MAKLKQDKDRLFVKRLAIRADNEQRITLGMRRAYILPTQKGIYYAITIVVMLVWSINYALSLGYAVTFFAAVFALIMMVLTVINLSGIEATAIDNVGSHSPFFVGDDAYFRLHIKNKKTEAALNFQAHRNGLLSSIISIDKHKHGIIEVPLDDDNRGIKKLTYVRLSSDYPMGIFRSWTWFRFDSSIIVYPSPSGSLPLPFRPEHLGIDTGKADLQGADDFADLRAYRPGDNLRHVVWKKAALGQISVKTFESLAGQECVLDFNDSRLTELDTETRLSQLCAWVLEVDKQRINYKLILPNKSIDFGSGQTHRLRCLEALACY